MSRLICVILLFITSQIAVAEIPVRAPIQLADISTAGFVGLATKGPLDRPTLVQDYNEYLSVFGQPGSTADYRHLGLAARAFFANGGTRLYVVRATDNTPSALIGSAVSPVGLAALTEIEDISLVAVPGATDTAIRKDIIQHCQAMQRFCLLDPATPDSVSATITERTQLETSSGHGALFFPWVRVDPGNGKTEVDAAPSGYVAGIYARTAVNDGVWKAPAGLSAELFDTTGLSMALSNDDNTQLSAASVNAIREIVTNSPPVIWGARTVSSDLDWKYVSVVRLASVIRQSFDHGLLWALYENNDALLWANIKADAGVFLDDLFRQGAFQGATPSEAYFVNCGLGSTMTQQDVDDGIIRVQIGFAPVKPAEFVVLSLVFDQTQADSDQDGLIDGIEDPNNNGVVDPGETDPLNPDTDGDGATDGQEDANANGIVDAGEADPLLCDTDGDGLTDGYEINIIGTSPGETTSVNTNPLGDINGDGEVNAGDAVLFQRLLFDLPLP